MRPLKKAYCRTYQAVFNIGARCLPWRKPESIAFPGCISEIPVLLNKTGAKRPCIVTGPVVKAKIAPRITEMLDRAGISYAHFDSVASNPTVDTVNAVRDTYVNNGCDSLIAIGGGSSMDAAKAAAAIIARPDKTIGQLGGVLRVRRKIPPFIAVPTTAGTGSETTIAAVVVDSLTHHKYAVMDLCLIPDYAVLDAELTVNLPPSVTAATGMDALTHAVEAYICRTYNTKESLLLAEQAVKLIFGNLERAYNDGSDMNARQNMLTASFKAGFAFTRAGVGNVHAIAHTLGGLYNTSHGLANAVILPVVLEDYGSTVYPKLARLAEMTGLVKVGTEEQRAKAFIREIYNMNKRMNIPDGFDFIKEEDIPQMTKWACAEANPLYPVPVLYDERRFARIIRKVAKPLI